MNRNTVQQEEIEGAQSYKEGRWFTSCSHFNICKKYRDKVYKPTDRLNTYS